MARRVRIENPGYHHIYNRGVEKRVTFADAKDKDKFLNIVCEVANRYNFVIHGYVIMDNHYHLLLENKKPNLSAGMRQINSLYAQYFNKRHNRVGHLWQDRFKSWYIFDENYLYTLFKYLEFNPIEANIVDKTGEYPFTFIHDMINGKLKNCMKDSFIFEWFNNSAKLLNSLGIELSKEEQRAINQFQKEAVKFKSAPKKVTQKLKLKDYFKDDMSKSERNEAILKAVKDGFAQSEVAKHLNLTDAAVSKIVKKLKVKP